MPRCPSSRRAPGRLRAGSRGCRPTSGERGRRSTDRCGPAARRQPAEPEPLFEPEPELLHHRPATLPAADSAATDPDANDYDPPSRHTALDAPGADERIIDHRPEALAHQRVPVQQPLTFKHKILTLKAYSRNFLVIGMLVLLFFSFFLVKDFG